MAHASSTFSMILCQLLSQKAESQSMTQKALLDKSGISQATWSRINRGQSSLTVEDLRSASVTLELELAALIADAETISEKLPGMDVEVVSMPKIARGPAAKSGVQSDTSSNGSFLTTIIAAAALAFLISKILKSK